MMSYINETDFVIENKKLVYPEIVADGLQLYYDAKGKRDTDYHRDTMLDMSGNKNHGKLHNFAYEKHSGYKDGLVFDYIDDKLVRPALNLKPDDFTFMLNGNIISFSPDGTVKRVQDGEVIESKGFNLIRNGDFVDGTKGWTAFQSKISVDNNGNLKVENNGGNTYAQVWRYIDLAPMSKYYFRAKFEIGNRDTKATPVDWFSGGVKSSEGLYDLLKENTSEEIVRRQLKFSDVSARGDYYYISDIQLINLTETFGAGNEPTKEQMDEIINRFGFIPNAQDLIDRVEYKGNDLGDMENIIDGLYKTEALTSEEVYTDKADDSVVHVEVDGKSYQHTGSGKNLFNLHTIPRTVSSSLLLTNETTNGFIVESTNTTSWQYIFWELSSELLPGKTYTIKLPFSILSGDISDTYGQINLDGTFLGTMKKEADSFILTFSTTGLVQDQSKLEFRLYVNGISNVSVKKIEFYNIQLEEGSTATAYEPPAPTPDYPVEIHSLNNFDVVSSVGKRNLLALSNMEFGGFNYQTGANGSGRPATDFKRTIELIPVSPETEYYLWHNLTPKEGSNGIEIAWTFYRMDKTAIRGKNQYGQNTSIITPSNAHFIKIRFGLNQVSWDDDKYLLIKSSNTNSWAPAPEDILEGGNHQLIDKINILLDEPLRSVSDVKDRLFRDTDGVWKIERKVGEDLLDSSSSMTNFGYSNYDTDVKTNRSFTPSADHDSRSNRARTTHFVRYEGSVWAETSGTGFRLNAYNQFHISFPNDVLGVTTSDPKSVRDNKIKEWLDSEKTKGTPLTIQYSLRTPVIETLDQELQDKLNNLRSFEDSNYVYTVLPNEDNYISNNPKPTLHAKFLYNNWYKEDRVINNLMIYNRALTNEEMLQNYKTIKRRWRM